MIIFDLDTLADDSHRRHFIDIDKAHELGLIEEEIYGDIGGVQSQWNCKKTGNIWQPDYSSYNAACEDDVPIQAVISIWNDQISLGGMGIHQVWTGRCESLKELTVKWLDKHLLCFNSSQLKMRPAGNTEPAHLLKERWLDEHMMNTMKKGGRGFGNQYIDFVFDTDAESIAMFRRRGIFVFDCRQ